MMNMTYLIINMAVLTVLLLATVTALISRRRLLLQLDKARTEISDVNMEIGHLKSQLSLSSQQGGVSEGAVLSLAGEMARMENNLSRMQDVPGRKQVIKALQRMTVALLAEGYTIVPLMGKPYHEGMMVAATFIDDENLPYGSSVISSVQTPQVNRYGKMIQAARVTVTQNI